MAKAQGTGHGNAKERSHGAGHPAVHEPRKAQAPAHAQNGESGKAQAKHGSGMPHPHGNAENEQRRDEQPAQQGAGIAGGQAVVNIGMIGHVDHGKCIALDSAILLNSELSDGKNLLSNANESGSKTSISESETVFDVPNMKAFSLSPSFELTSVPAKLFTQNYSGKMIEIETKRGKRITVSPKHPLLVNDGKELTWVEGQKLRAGDSIAALRSLPDQEFIKDFSSNWKEELEKSCWIVTREEFIELRGKTKEFTRFDTLSVDEINKLRILSGNSFLQLEKKAESGITSAFKMGKFTKSQLKALTAAFAKMAFDEPESIVINYKRNTRSFCRINAEDHFGNDVLRFLAFVIGEGQVTSASVRFSQERNEMLKKMRELCKSLFSCEPSFYPPVDYHINNKALVCFLETRYAVKVGNSRASGIPEWIFSLPKSRLSVFLNWFFTLEGNFNSESSQIALIQANKKSISVISYALKKFGILHSIHDIEKVATNSKKKTRRTYWQLLISGIGNIGRFRMQIGVSLPKKAKSLEEMSMKKQHGKESDEMVPLDFKLLSELVGLLGWKKKNYSMKATKMRNQPWFFAYNDSAHKNSMSRKNLDIFIAKCKERIRQLKSIAVNSGQIKLAMAEIGISQNELAQKIGLTQKTVHTVLKKQNQGAMSKVGAAIAQIATGRAAAAEGLIGKITGNSPQNIEWDRIKSAKEIEYKGPIIDLQVPGYHNFVAGIGAIVSHNTSLVKALTGKWADTHSEEIKQGISIRLGYADTTFYKCDLARGSEGYNVTGVCGEGMGRAVPQRRVSFIDAPGHETLMATMLSGAALMDGAVLVVAANEKCPQPSTAEHLMALSIGGVRNVVVAQNKIDLVDQKRAKESHDEIVAFLKQYGCEGAPIIPIAANLGLNIDLLIEAIEKTIQTPRHGTEKALRMFVVRSFDVNKPGTKPAGIKGGVLGGSIVSGILKVGDVIEVSPGIEGKPVETTVVSLGVESGRVKEAHAGGLIAVGTTLDPFYTKNDEMRGQIVAQRGSLPKPETAVKLEVKPLERLVEKGGSDLKVNDFVVLAIATSTVVGQVVRQSGKSDFEISLRSPAVFEKGQKVAISKRESSGWRLRAYGICK